MQNSHTEVWDQTCDMGLFCDSGWGFGERRLLKYSCINLQLGHLSSTLPRDAEFSWTLLLHTPTLAQGILPIGEITGVSLAALTTSQGESHCLVVIQACGKSLAFLQAWLMTRWLILCTSRSCCVPKCHGGLNGSATFSRGTQPLIWTALSAGGVQLIKAGVWVVSVNSFLKIKPCKSFFVWEFKHEDTYTVSLFWKF